MDEISVKEMQGLVGLALPPSPWIVVDQAMIDGFADLTGDRQFIHVDPGRARAEGPFGTTVAHGLLSLSLLPQLAQGTVPRLRGLRSSVNYGFDRVRFVTPVAAGARVRGHFTLKRVEPRGADGLLTLWEVRVEIEGEARPALLADWLGLRYLEEMADAPAS